MMRARSPAGMRPPVPWRSRPSWFFRVQMTASTRWRSQFGNGRGCFSSLRAGREQVPDRARGGAQPVPLVVAPEQDLRHGQAGELGVGDVRRPSRPAAAGPAQRDDPVGQFHVECGQEGVQVGGHDGLRGPDV